MSDHDDVPLSQHELIQPFAMENRRGEAGLSGHDVASAVMLQSHNSIVFETDERCSAAPLLYGDATGPPSSRVSASLPKG
jgi:hypothetical protein